MASHVVVLDASARRATVKTTPEKHLTEILRDACKKLGRNPDCYGLKYNNKALDLSRNVRLTGLSSGAKLELLLSSRSPSVVSVALQLPEPDLEGSSRLTDKFSSNSTLWMVLRKFESEMNGMKRNYTGRGISVPNEDGRDTGRIYFETPVIQIMGRELFSFTDLQKTLAQLGFNSGSTLLRLSFRRTETPLEEAMQEIGQYFSEVDGQSVKTAHGDSADQVESLPQTSDSPVPPAIAEEPSPPEPVSSEPSSQTESKARGQEEISVAEISPLPAVISGGDTRRLVTVFSPSSSNTPEAAQQAFDEKDYEPTIHHAKLHQSRLAAKGANKRLPSDAELAAQAETQAQRNANVTEVEIKVRFPDQMQAISMFSNQDTADTLYEFVKSLMVRENEPFSLRFTAANGPKSIPTGPQGDVKLVSGLGMLGRVLVNVVWEEGASLQARSAPVLKDKYRENAQEIAVKQVEATTFEEKAQPTSISGGKETKERKGGTPKWFKQLGKK